MSKLFSVEIKELTFETIIGILDFERENPQKVIVDLSFSYPFYDNSKEFVDYAKVSSLVKTTMIEKKFELIEEALNYLEKLLLKNFSIINLSITITKPDILDDCIVSVSV